MKNENLTIVFTVDQSPEEVFNAINNVAGWWADIEGNSDKLGGEFTYRHKDVHRSTQRITEFVPGKRVVWHVIGSSLNFVKDKKEWNNTDIVFEISRKQGRTELRFTHVGFVPARECYTDCLRGWNFYVNESLRSLITTGKGDPN